jgi:prepilin-type N-terminal cleavage/methylation domain-containing protein
MTKRCRTALREGFTLVELMVGLVLLLAVGGVTYQLLVNTQRVTRAQGQRIGMQDNGRSGALIIQNELREVGYDQITASALPGLLVRFPTATLAASVNSDIRAIGPDSITYRAMRGLGYTCDLTGAASGDIVVFGQTGTARGWQGYRLPTSTDSLLVYVENDGTTSADDIWVTVGVSTPVAQNCPAGGGAGVKLHISVPAALNIGATALISNMSVGGPVRAFELMQVRTFTTGGKTWLGLRSRPTTGGTSLEPVIGPLAGPTGLAFAFKDANDAATTVRDNVSSVELTLQPMSDELVRTAGRTAKVDTLTMTTRVALRNALRP